MFFFRSVDYPRFVSCIVRFPIARRWKDGICRTPFYTHSLSLNDVVDPGTFSLAKDARLGMGGDWALGPWRYFVYRIFSCTLIAALMHPGTSGTLMKKPFCGILCKPEGT